MIEKATEHICSFFYMLSVIVRDDRGQKIRYNHCYTEK